MSIINIGLDASNLREGGGITHLVELLTSAKPENHCIRKIIIWGVEETLEKLPRRPWLDLRMPPEIRRGQFARARWQRYTLGVEARAAGCHLLFAPGGNYPGDFRPFVTMSRNMLPFDRREVARYGYGLKRLRLEILRRVQTRSFQRADGLIFLTHFAQESIMSIIGEVRGRVATIPHGVNASFSVPDRRFRDIASCHAGSPFRLVYISHASPYKHQWHVITAIAELRGRTGWPLQLDMLGPSSVASSVARINAALAQHDPDRVWAHFHGPQPRAVLQDYLAQSDLGIFASSCENMPNVLLEKMAAGLPLACSDRGPMPECLRQSGELFDPESPTSIGAAVARLISDRTLRQRLSIEARERAKEFTWQRCADETLAFLRQVAELARHIDEPRIIGP